MQTKDIIGVERQNGEGIFLYKEGIFWRAYNQSAFQFSKHFKAFKLTKKFVKRVGEEVISLGFPDKLLPTFLESAKDNNLLVEQNENKIRISGLPKLTKETYEEWARKVLVKTVVKDSKDQNPVSHEI